MLARQDVVTALRDLGGQGSLEEIYGAVARRSRSLTPSWKATVRGILERNSSDSTEWNKRDDLFYSVNGIGQGRWGLRSMR